MLERNLFEIVEQPQGGGNYNRKKFNTANLYRFYMDRSDIADNQVKKWKNKPGNPIEVSANLINLISDVYQVAIVELEEEEEEEEVEQILDVEQGLMSKEYKKYLAACGELQVVDLDELSETQKIAFFLNVY